MRRSIPRSSTLALLAAVVPLIVGCGGSSRQRRDRRSTAASTNRRPRCSWRPSNARPASRSKCASATRPRSATRSCRRARTRRPTSSTARTRPCSKACASRGCSRRVAPSTLARRAQPATARREGDWVGVSARVSALVYNTSELARRAAAELDPRTRRAASGRARSASRPRRPTSSRWSRRSSSSTGRPAAERWLKGLQANGDGLPGQRDGRRPRSTTARARSAPINHYYWYRLRERARHRRDALGAALLRAGDPGDLVDVSGAAVLALELAQGRGAALPRLPRQPRRPGGDRPQPQLRVPAAPRRRARAPALPPLAALQPAPLTPAELGDGSAALALEQKLGLL